jgi:hypothetical protein
MDNVPTKYFSTCEDATTVEYKNSVIIVIITMFLLSILGINVFGFGAKIIDFITDIFAPIFRNVLDMFGYSFGSALKNAAGDVKKGAVIGVEVVGDSVRDAGDIIMEQTHNESFMDLDTYLNTAPNISYEVETMVSSNPLQH